MDFLGLEKLIENSRGNVVEFGNAVCDLNPTPNRVMETEDYIGAKLPPSYLWFVSNYGGGEIHGEEIFSIYRVFEKESVGDIGVNTGRYREDGFIEPTEIAVCVSGFGEIFTLDTANSEGDGEYRVFVRRGKHREVYAQNFAEFLVKRIEDS